METFLTILLDGLQFSSYLFIVSAGLTIIFGVMKILNVAHGSFYAWGAYTAAFFIGKFSDMGMPDAMGFLIIVAAAIVVGVILGFVIEQGILKYMYDRDEVLIVETNLPSQKLMVKFGKVVRLYQKQQKHLRYL